MTSPRKGASRAADIPPDVLLALSRGELPSATLAEGLALDQAVLARTVFPQLCATALQAIDEANRLGVLKRMRGIANVLQHELGSSALRTCQTHQSDTVRGWACFMLEARTDLPLDERLAAILPLADDAHFGVREWAWMATRPHLSPQLARAITQLSAWAKAPSANVRRFACEVLRPRGVWCAHIPPLKQTPEQALPVLTPLRADPSRYVQNSVANWLNDAAKSQPDWVRALCQDWLQASPTEATRHICRRAQRSVS